MNLKEELQARFNMKEEEFDTYHSDLYVKVKPGIINYLREKKVYFTIFRSNKPPIGLWFDIPFANTKYFERKGKNV